MRVASWALLGCVAVCCLGGEALAADAPATSTLKAFHDEAELQAFLDKVRKPGQEAWEARRKGGNTNSTGNLSGQTTAGSLVAVDNAATGFHRQVTADANGNYRISSLQPGTYTVTVGGQTKEVTVSLGGTASLSQVAVVGGAPPSAPEASAVPLLAPGTVTDAGAASDSITNVQTAGVDEGGIVKKSGDFLVILRRGRLFSVRVSANAMERVSSVNAYGPDVNGAGAWYDEMLISRDKIVVIGYSYERDATEVGLFNLSPKGQISYIATYQLFSNDYYSSRNYASRLIGNTLIFYTPIDVFSYDYKQTHFPGFKRWNKAAPKAEFRRIVPAQRIYDSGLADPRGNFTLHSVTRCQIGANGMDCRSSSVFGPSGSEFYVSTKAVYVWVVDWRSDEDTEASVIRMPLDESAPSALRVQGAPIDQLSFLEKDGYLNVLVGADAKGLRMWAAEGASGGLALLRVSLNQFGNSEATSTAKDYRAMPSGFDNSGFWDAHNRYVGNWLLYGGGDAGKPAYAVRIDRRDPATRLDLHHDVDRIEGMGADALIVGSAKDGLHMSGISLRQSAKVASELVMRGAEEAEERTHGFFYKPIGVEQGMFGLPVVKEHSASVQFLRNSQLKLSSIGELAATTRGRMDERADACVASCYDWYGDSQPIFIGERVYGLLGYELVEGTMRNGKVIERRRLDFGPKRR